MNKKLNPNLFFEGDMTNWNYYHVFKNVTRSHFVKVILGGKDYMYTGGTEPGSWTLRLLFLNRIIENKNSDFVMA